MKTNIIAAFKKAQPLPVLPECPPASVVRSRFDVRIVAEPPLEIQPWLPLLILSDAPPPAPRNGHGRWQP